MRPQAAEPRTDRYFWLVALIVGALAAYNVARSAAIPEGAHFVANFAIAAALLTLGLVAGMTKSELGLSCDRWRDGARLGLLAVGVIGAATIIVAVVPPTAGYFDDDRVKVSFGSMLWRVLIVIPVGTVLVEEIVFRGVLHGLLIRRREIVATALWGATLFGLWHLFPVWRSYSDVAFSDLGRWGEVAGTFVATFAAGLGFIWLRLRSDSLVAPILAHIGTNSIPFAAAWIVSP